MLSNNALKWLSNILSERFGHACFISKCLTGYVLNIDGISRKIILCDSRNAFTKQADQISYAEWDPVSEGYISKIGNKIPTPGGCESDLPLIRTYGDDVYINYDILGMMYWMLLRVEEVASNEFDKHQRFPAIASHAYKHKYLDIPVIDLWIDILKQVIHKELGLIFFKKNSFKINVSHDVDRPSRYGFDGIKDLLIHMSVDAIIHKKNISRAPFIKLNTKEALLEYDPYNTFKFIMNLSEKYGLKSAFYFLCGNTSKRYDSNYSIDHMAIRNLLKEINCRGHEIGLHPSYNSFRNSKVIKDEFNFLKKICEQESISQESWGSRMHYLRWKSPQTLIACEEAGLDYDATLAYADMVGFRCGTCFEYVGFNIESDTEMNIKIKPLIIMEDTLYGYMGLNDNEEILGKIEHLKSICKKVEGVFSVLWHNSSLITHDQKFIYEQSIK